MKELNAAYEVLSDPVRRARYDRSRSTVSPSVPDSPSRASTREAEGVNQRRQNAAGLRFAEWYVWAKREVSSDNRVCLGAAQAAIEALDAGRNENAARLAARQSVAGRGVALAQQVSPRIRVYAEWYDWSRQTIRGTPREMRQATEAALHCLETGGSSAHAEAAAWQAAGRPEPLRMTQAASVQARCERTANPIVLRLEQSSPGEWVITECVAFELSPARSADGRRFDKQPSNVTMTGSIVLAYTYAGCPYCRADSITRCTACEGVSCAQQTVSAHRCPWCGSASEMAGVLNSLDGTLADQPEELYEGDRPRHAVIEPPSSGRVARLPPGR